MSEIPVQRSKIYVDPTLLNSIAAISDDTGIPRATLVLTGLVPLLRKHSHLLPIAYTTICNGGRTLRGPGEGMQESDPVTAYMKFPGKMIAVIRGPVLRDGKIIRVKTASRNVLHKWWRSLIGIAIKKVWEIHPEQYETFAFLNELFVERGTNWAFSYHGQITDWMKGRPPLPIPVLRIVQSTILWYENERRKGMKADAATFYPQIREGIRFLQDAADVSTESGEPLLKHLKITFPGAS